MNHAPLLAVEGLRKDYPGRAPRPFARERPIRILDGVSFTIGSGETLGLVGESGSGKSTTGRIVLKLQSATGGSVRFGGEEILHKHEKDFRPFRSRMQMIFQDPGASLNPSYRIGTTLAETLAVSGRGSDAAQRRAMVAELLLQVGLDPNAAQRYPHEFSGGQRQRIGIARALAVRPRLIVADEPVSALDVSIQAQILNLMRDLKQELGIAYLFIAHDLAVVKQMSDRVAVMYRGRIVETAPSREIFRRPAHPYTRLLLGAVPGSRGAGANAAGPAAHATAADRPAGVGCLFASRCPLRIARCDIERPVTATIGPAHEVACHRPQ